MRRPSAVSTRAIWLFWLTEAFSEPLAAGSRGKIPSASRYYFRIRRANKTCPISLFLPRVAANFDVCCARQFNAEAVALLVEQRTFIEDSRLSLICKNAIPFGKSGAFQPFGQIDRNTVRTSVNGPLRVYEHPIRLLSRRPQLDFEKVSKSNLEPFPCGHAISR
jgi:hypothetical protein